MVEILVYVLLMGFSSCLQGVTGFGYALIAAPLALIFLPTETMVISMVIISVVLNAVLMGSNSASVKPKLLKLLLLGGIIGLPLGVVILYIVPPTYLKLMVGCLSILFSILIFFGRVSLPKGKLTAVMVGFLTGVLQSSVSISGPPIVLYLLSLKMEKFQMKKTLAVLFFIISLVTLLIFYIGGKLTLDHSIYGLVAIPAVILGGKVGNRLTGYFRPATFRLIALLLMIATGAYTIWSVI